jgi:hypothetical protein
LAGPAFDELLITLFSQRRSIGLVPIGQWRRLFSRAKRGDFIGVARRPSLGISRSSFDTTSISYKIRARYRARALTLKELNEF